MRRHNASDVIADDSPTSLLASLSSARREVDSFVMNVGTPAPGLPCLVVWPDRAISRLGVTAFHHIARSAGNKILEAWSNNKGKPRPNDFQGAGAGESSDNEFAALSRGADFEDWPHYVLGTRGKSILSPLGPSAFTIHDSRHKARLVYR